MENVWVEMLLYLGCFEECYNKQGNKCVSLTYGFYFPWIYIYLADRLLDHVVNPFLIFWQNSTLFSIMATLTYISSNGIHFFQMLVIFDLLITQKGDQFGHSNCTFLIISDVEHLFINLVAILMSSFKEHLFKSFAHF